MITVHHLNNSRSQRVLWLLEELGVPYELKHYQRDANRLAPPELQAVHPLGKSPVITDGDQTIAESAVILEYLIDTYGQGRMRPAAGTPEHMQYSYFMHYAEGSLMPWMFVSLVLNAIENAPVPFFIKPITRQIAKRTRGTLVSPNVKRHLDFLESRLARHAWFAGDELSAADVQLSFPIEAATARAGLSSTKWPKLSDFLERIHARPAYQRALERGGPFSLA